MIRARVFLWLRHITDPQVRAAARKAAAYMAASHPDVRVDGTSLRADKPERFVFAVFHSRPSFPSRPHAYRLAAVSRVSDEVAEITPPPESKYRFRGRK